MAEQLRSLHVFQYFNCFLMCFLLFSLHPHPISLPPQCPVKPLSHLFLPQCCRTKPSKLSLRCPCPPNPPSPPPLHWLQLPLLWWKKPQCLRLISSGWISDSSPLFFPSLFHFFLSSSVSVSGWWGEWSWSGGCAVGGGWSGAGMTRLVRCMRVSVSDATVAQRSGSYHIFRWLLRIFHRSQLLFQALKQSGLEIPDIFCRNLHMSLK